MECYVLYHIEYDAFLRKVNDEIRWMDDVYAESIWCRVSTISLEEDFSNLLDHLGLLNNWGTDIVRSFIGGDVHLVPLDVTGGLVDGDYVNGDLEIRHQDSIRVCDI